MFGEMPTPGSPWSSSPWWRDRASISKGEQMRTSMIGIVLMALASGDPVIIDAQANDTLPFATGERLTYRLRVPKMRASGRGAMWIEGPVDVRGTPAYLLRFEMKAGLGPIKGVDRTHSWLDRDRMASLRYAKHESHPLSRHD